MTKFVCGFAVVAALFSFSKADAFIAECRTHMADEVNLVVTGSTTLLVSFDLFRAGPRTLMLQPQKINGYSTFSGGAQRQELMNHLTLLLPAGLNSPQPGARFEAPLIERFDGQHQEGEPFDWRLKCVVTKS